MKKSVTFFSKPEIVLFVPAHKCEDCGLEFQTISGLEDHAERSHRREWVRCLICVKTVKHAEHFVIWNICATAENIYLDSQCLKMKTLLLPQIESTPYSRDFWLWQELWDQILCMSTSMLVSGILCSKGLWRSSKGIWRVKGGPQHSKRDLKESPKRELKKEL